MCPPITGHYRYSKDLMKLGPAEVQQVAEAMKAVSSPLLPAIVETVHAGASVPSIQELCIHRQ